MLSHEVGGSLFLVTVPSLPGFLEGKTGPFECAEMAGAREGLGKTVDNG